MPSRQEIIEYYAGSKLDYRLYNRRLNDLSMHYGIWDRTTRTHRDALSNENRVVADAASVGSGDHVLDLGCGYGSTAVWLASYLRCRVTGITLSASQVRDARALAIKRNVAELADFVVGDFHEIPFPNQTFTVVMAIESISHSSDKLRVLSEAQRVLKPGGRLAIADGFFAKDKKRLNPHEQALARTCFEGVHVPPLPERSEFEQWLRLADFERVHWFDKTSCILPTARQVNRLGKFLLPLSQILSTFGFRALQPAHMRAFIAQDEAFRSGLGAYGIFSAVKPVAVPKNVAVEESAGQGLVMTA